MDPAMWRQEVGETSAASQGFSIKHYQQQHPDICTPRRWSNWRWRERKRVMKTLFIHQRTLLPSLSFSPSDLTVALCWLCLRGWCSNFPSFINTESTINCLVSCQMQGFLGPAAWVCFQSLLHNSVGPEPFSCLKSSFVNGGQWQYLSHKAVVAQENQSGKFVQSPS